MDFMETVRRRRSVRAYSAEPVPDEILDQILEAGRLAPSGGNAQNCYFGVIKEQSIKEELARAAGGQDWIAGAPVVIAYCSYVDEDLAALPEDDFGLIVNQVRFGKDFITYLNQYPGRKAVNTFWENGSPLIPGEHIALAAANFGLQTCWIGYLDIGRAGDILKLPDDVVCLFLMPLGYPGEAPSPSRRKPLAGIVFHDQWTL
jgi:nitroreductase